MVIPAFLVNPDQPQGIGAALVTHPATHGQNNLVSSSNRTDAPQYLQRFPDDFLDIMTYRLVLHRIDIAYNSAIRRRLPSLGESG